MTQFLKELIWHLDLWPEIVTEDQNFQQVIIFTFDKNLVAYLFSISVR